MKFIVTGEQMQIAEKNAVLSGLPLLTLMENAGRECYGKIHEIMGGVEDKTFVILCGRGNNGGDGIVISKYLVQNGGAALCIFVTDLPNTECSREIYSRYSDSIDSALFTHREDAAKKALESCDGIIDCVFGTGFHGELEPRLAKLFRFINDNCRGVKISVDVPSGIDATTGEVSEGTFRPDVTLMLGAAKTGLFSRYAAEISSCLVLLDIGIKDECYSQYVATITGVDIFRYIPKRPLHSHKGDYGRLLSIGGSERYIGAALLSAKAALKSGVGLLTLACPKTVCQSIAPAIPEAIFCQLFADLEGYIDAESITHIEEELKNADAVAIGPGLGKTEDTAKLTEFVLKNAECPIILDADGINSIAANINVLKDNDKLKILTPHPGELSRMIGVSVKEIEQNRLKYASHYAREWNVVLLLKGASTVIAAPDGRMSVNPTGNPGLAKGGSGDVLTGLIASFVAQGVDGYEAALLGAYLHGLAAERLSKSVALAGILPSDIAEYLPFIMKG